SVPASSSSTASFGRGVSKFLGKGLTTRHVRAKARSASSRRYPGHPRLSCLSRKQDVDGRDKSGHDGILHARLGRAAYAFINKPVRFHILVAIDVAQIDHDRMRHLGFQPLEVER